MKKIQISLLFLLVLFSCRNNEAPNINSHFDEETGILEIEYGGASDGYLLPILRHSHIRQKGYGILLNIENALPKSKQEAILNKFRKSDINAVHIFDINRNSLPKNTRIAIEGARFTWLFIGKEEDPLPVCKELKIPLKKSIYQGGIIVIDQTINKNLKKCLID